MGVDAGIGEAALADAAIKGGTDAAAGAGAGGGILDALGLGGLFGGGEAAADAAGAAGAFEGLGDAAGAAAPWAFDPGFAASDLAYLGAGDAASLGGEAGAGAAAGAGAFDPLTAGGASAFDAGTFGGAGAGSVAADAGLGGGSLPAWLTGSTMFDSGLPGAASSELGAGGGVSSFGDTMAAGGFGPTTVFQGGGGASAADLGGGGAAFTPGEGIQGADITALDPTSGLGTGDTTLNAPVVAEDTPLPEARPPGAGPSAAELANNSSLPANATPTSGTLAPGGVPVTDASGTVNAPGLTTEPSGGGAAASGGNGKFLGMNVGTPSLFGVGGAALSGGLLATNLLNRNQVPGQSQVNAINSTIPQIQSTIDNVNQTAAQLRDSTQPLTADAKAMMSYVSQGTLPPAMQAQVSAGVQAAKAQAASIMASHGLSADPNSNAQLKQQYDTIDSQAIQLQGQLANQLYQSGIQAQQTANQTQQVAAGLQQTGLNAVGLTDNTYLALQKIYADQDTKQQAAIQNFAGALGKITGGGGTTIKIGS